MKITLMKELLRANDQVALENRAFFDSRKIFSLNIMASPGAGKTSFILATAERLPQDIKVGVIEGDVASSLDAQTIASRGIPVIQVNTGGSCHLDAPMIRSALSQSSLGPIDLLFVENVGNLVCPAYFPLGTHLNVVIASLPEGQDKPYKYPDIFAIADVIILNKVDLLPFLDFDLEYFKRGIYMVNPEVPIFPLSCKTGEGFEKWMTWLLLKVRNAFV
ncbi:MAG: hydrogenase nickel incorporation protein HypB [Anaerolineae bacterium]|nr:hydrogenase nickel incorporation protein HypB [Anaerolineae bacterium]MDW8103286.1 hydrogenase nickel incorporation protein HypB [Anaerolineae bacterium]